MEELIAAATKAIDELEGYYDGAPDSPTLWLGTIVEDLRSAVERAERAMDRWREEQDELHHRYPGLYPNVRGR